MGQSLGGVCSSWYVKDFPDKMKGVVLWAAYGFPEGSIQDRDVSVIVISGTKDGLAHFIPNTIGSSPFFPAVLIFNRFSGRTPDQPVSYYLQNRGAHRKHTYVVVVAAVAVGAEIVAVVEGEGPGGLGTVNLPAPITTIT